MADYRKIIPFIIKAEGGLSKAKTDTASKYPVPDGSGYHTNKGVTWRTFQALAPKLDYVATASLFYDMPENIWVKIWKYGYWNRIGGDELNSQPVADLLADFAWASGPGAAVKGLQRVLNAMGHKLEVDGMIGPNTLGAANKANAASLFERLTNYRQEFIKALNQPANEKGWLNRLAALVELKKKNLEAVA